MRLLRLRVLDAGTAGTMRLNDALLRWIGLAGAIGILGLVPGLEGYIGLIGAIWLVVLLVSTGTDRLHQGLHDRWARSVVVQPAPGGSGMAIATCLVLVVLIGLVLPIRGDPSLRRPAARPPDRDRELGLTMGPALMREAVAAW